MENLNVKANEFFTSLKLENNKFASINLEYDKSSNTPSYIFTHDTALILNRLLLSVTQQNIKNKSFVLTGAYGTGKSHLILEYLRIISEHKESDLLALAKRLEQLKIENSTTEFDDLIRLVNLRKLPKLLPVVIKSGFSNLRQCLQLSLKNCLRDNGLDCLRTQSSGDLAVAIIDKWQTDYPQTYQNFISNINLEVEEFKEKLLILDEACLTKFTEIYPKITSGAEFTPENSADPVVLYSDVNAKIKQYGYDGITIVFDEFSKFLETGINSIGIGETKIIQDLAEFCSKSEWNDGKAQVMSFIVITHKDISNYIDTLPKKLIDGWRGVSERFYQIYMPQNYNQISTIISLATGVSEDARLALPQQLFEDENLLLSELLKNVVPENFSSLVYPLHSITAYLLIRFSELIGQNERSIFSYFSSNDVLGYKYNLSKIDKNNWDFILPNSAFDYFEQRIKVQVYDRNIMNCYDLYSYAKAIIQEAKLDLKVESLAIKLIKTIISFQLLGFTSLKAEHLSRLYSNFNTAEVLDSLVKLGAIRVHKIKQTLSLSKDEHLYVNNLIDKQIKKNELKNVSIIEIVNSLFEKDYIYPDRYNDEQSITRYFRIHVLDNKAFSTATLNSGYGFKQSDKNYRADGDIYFLIEDYDSYLNACESLNIDELNKDSITLIAHNNSFFISIGNRSAVLSQYRAISDLKQDLKGEDSTENRELLGILEQFEVELYPAIKELKRELLISSNFGLSLRVISANYVNNYKASGEYGINDVLSDLCYKVFSNYLPICNEMIVKDYVAGVTSSATYDVISKIFNGNEITLASYKETSQQATILRTVLKDTGFIKELDGKYEIQELKANTKAYELSHFILDWITDSEKTLRKRNFGDLIQSLRGAEFGFGLRLGVLPLLLVWITKDIKKSILISYINNASKLEKTKLNRQEFTPELLRKMLQQPESYIVEYVQWKNINSLILEAIKEVFTEQQEDNSVFNLDSAANAINNWYLNLSKFSRHDALDNLDYLYKPEELEEVEKHSDCYRGFIKKTASKIFYSPRSAIFEELPKLLEIDAGRATLQDIIDKLKAIKNFYENLLIKLENSMVDELKNCLLKNVNQDWELHLTNLSNIASAYTSCVKSRLKHDNFNNDLVNEIISLSQRKNKYSDLEILNELAIKTTNLRIADWSRKQIELFVEKIEILNIDKLEDYSNKFLVKNDKLNILEEFISNYEFNSAETNKQQLLVKDFIYQLQNYRLSKNEQIDVLLRILRKIQGND